MKRAFTSKILLLLGMISFLLGSGAALSSPMPDQDSALFIGGAMSHAMKDMTGDGPAMDGCKDKQSGGCCNCDLAPCGMTGASAVLVPDVVGLTGQRLSSVHETALDTLGAGLNRHNLPLPPP